MMSDTICAIATPPGIGATAMIRISGNDAFEFAKCLFLDKSKFAELSPNVVKFFTIYYNPNLSNPVEFEILDQVIVTKFANPHSFTGEDVVEISCHGSVFIQRKIVETLIQNGCRMANPGEFTQRAFLNGKFDLPQAEAIADLIDAQSETSHSLAIKQLQGLLSNKLFKLHEDILNIATLLELELDFSEEDVEFADREHLLQLLDSVDKEVNQLLNNYKFGNMLKHGVPVAIVGKPNVGKSTLMNAILQKDRAIVSDIPGTTRDTVEDFFNINGVLFRFIDTAGIRQSDDKIEQLGIQRTIESIKNAAIVLYLQDANVLDRDNQNELEQLNNLKSDNPDSIIHIVNKCDTLSSICKSDDEKIYISALTGTNVDILLNKIYQTASQLGFLSDRVLVSNERHFSCLTIIHNHIESVKNGVSVGLSSDLIAEDVRVILHNLGEITGKITSDDVLNNIFANFCIGK